VERTGADGAARLRAVVWDMDGTLVDSSTAVPDAYIGAIARIGGPVLTREAIIASYSLGPPQIMLGHLLGRRATAADVDEYLAQLRTTVSEARPYPGVAATLERLRDRVGLGVFTGASRPGALILLEAAGLLRFFRTVVGGDQVEHQKPAPDGVRRACAELGVEPASAAYVGDSPSDLEAARKAGALAIGAAWGHLYSPAATADLVLERPEDVLDLLRR
jgi:HAD superfamily hydrolase (TIGR01509 family)